ncbi:hypothetical protein CGLAMM_09920 [Acetobacteraceae bacterium EV16G]|uniref:Beta-ketoacyl synthase-like N-terminal domain-containing protein n=1 Tax=Sorlinia euscelidii TaxID=3081148 RepID=A0ABU7U6J5_9PROT
MMAKSSSTESRRVVVTGIGLVTPLAVGVEHSWKKLIEGQSGIRRITSFDPGDLPVLIGGEVPSGPTQEGG